MARSAAFTRCMCGGVSWKSCFSFARASFKYLEASLSIIQNFVVIVFLVILLYKILHFSVISVAFLDLRGIPSIRLES